MDGALLEQLRAALARHGAPIVDRLRPGLTDVEIDAELAPLGLRPPADLRRWWGWHDGAVPAASKRPSPEELIGPFYPFVSCSEAVHDYVQGRRVLRKGLSSLAGVVDEAAVDEWWPESWLPFTGGPADLAIDCGFRDHEGSGRIHLIPRDEPYPDPVADSLGELVSGWIAALDVDAWSYGCDEHGARWFQDPSLLPDHLRLNPAFS